MNSLPNSLRGGPDSEGHFGAYGGRFVAETLMPLLLDLEKAYEAAKKDPSFKKELDDLLVHYAGHHADPDGRLRARFETLYLTGWSPHESQQHPLKPGSAKTRLAEALGTDEYPIKE